jgi:hypothetical protein
LPALTPLRKVLVTGDHAVGASLLFFALLISLAPDLLPSVLGDYRLQVPLFLGRDLEPIDDLLVREPVAGVALLALPLTGLIATQKATRNPPFGALPLVFASLGGHVLVFVEVVYLDSV